LTALFENAADEGVSKGLRARLKKLRGMLEEEYGFFPDQSLEEKLSHLDIKGIKQLCCDDEDMPAIVAEEELGQFISFD
jgi:hypothetical protein